MLSGFIGVSDDEPYTTEILRIIDYWKVQCKKKSEEHTRISRMLYVNHVLVSMPGIIVPVVMVFVSQTIEDQDLNRIISGIAFLISGVFNALNQFFKFQKQSQKHETASDRYAEVINLVEFDMSRQERYRVPADVMMERLKYQIKYLQCYSPSLENACVSDCCI